MFYNKQMMFWGKILAVFGYIYEIQVLNPLLLSEKEVSLKVLCDPPYIDIAIACICF